MQGRPGLYRVEISWLLGLGPFLSGDQLYRGREEDAKNKLGVTSQLQMTRLTLASELATVHPHP